MTLLSGDVVAVAWYVVRGFWRICVNEVIT